MADNRRDAVYSGRMGGFPKMKTAIKCRCCGKMFRPANSKVKICSDECRLMMKRRCAVNAVRRYRAKGAITEKTCPICGNEFWPNLPYKIYCGEVCHKKANNEQTRLKRRKDPPPDQTCIICGRLFRPVNKQQFLCSAACKHEYRKMKKREYYYRDQRLKKEAAAKEKEAAHVPAQTDP